MPKQDFGPAILQKCSGKRTRNWENERTRKRENEKTRECKRENVNERMRLINFASIRDWCRFVRYVYFEAILPLISLRHFRH